MKGKKKEHRDLIKECAKDGYISTDCTFFLHMGFEDKKIKTKPSNIDDVYLPQFRPTDD
jgi:hypothetical protein